MHIDSFKKVLDLRSNIKSLLDGIDAVIADLSADRSTGARASTAPAESGEPVTDTPITETVARLRAYHEWLSANAPRLPAELLREHVSYLTALARQEQTTTPLQTSNGQVLGKIMRALTAIVSEYRPGHVYGLARHHQADWSQQAATAYATLCSAAPENQFDLASAPIPAPVQETPAATLACPE